MNNNQNPAATQEEIQLYRVPEVAKRLGISVSSVRRLIDDRLLPARRIGKSVTVSHSAIKTFLAGLESKE